MDVNTITQLIGTVGFPICCVVALFIREGKDAEARREERRIEREARAEEADKWTTAINNNTTALRELVDYIKGGRAA